jgi:vitamin B12 transporter
MKFLIRLMVAGLITGGMWSAAGVSAQVPPRYTLDPVIVTATRTETAWSRIGSAVEVVTGDQLRESGAVTLLEALAAVPGVAITRAGPAAGTGSLLLRGSKGEHLLVLIDGIVANDPISPGGSFDWNTISADAVERIEIVKGPQSTLYGSDAIAGVVQIITRQPTEPAGGYLQLETGSYQTFNATAGISAELLGNMVRAELSRRELGGISTASERYGNSEPDSWEMWSGALKFTRPVGDNRLEVSLRGSRSRFDLDDFGGPFGDDPNGVGWKSDLTGSASLSLQLKERWLQRIRLGFSSIHRWGEDRSDPDHPDEQIDSDYTGFNRNIEWQHTIELNAQTLAAGVSLDHQSGKSTYIFESSGFSFSDMVPGVSQTALAIYLQDQFDLGPVVVTAGGRLDSYSDYGSQPTFRLAMALPLSAVRIRASAGTGFRVPSLYQRFSPDYGNEYLEAEKSFGYDAGFEVVLFDRGRVGISRFRQDIEEMIDFVTDPVTWLSRFENRSRLRLEGWEADLGLAITGQLGLDANFSSLDIEDDPLLPLLRRPDRTAAIGLGYQPSSQWVFGLRARYTGERNDKDWSQFPSEVVKLEPVTVLDGEVTYRFGPSVDLRLRLRNIANENPEWVWGYGSLGRAVYLGFSIRR